MREEQAVTKREGSVPENIYEGPVVAPPVDIYENKDEYLLIADLPGVAHDKLNVSFNKDQLTLEAKGSAAPEGSVLNEEFTSCNFRRVFSVPRGIDADKIGAEFKQGVLWLHLPKAAHLKPRQIPVTQG